MKFIYLFFISGMLVFLFNYNYLLINLLSIEYMMLTMINLMYYIFNKMNFDLFFIMMFLTFMVTEGVTGLSILISMIRNYGNNNLLNIYYLKF